MGAKFKIFLLFIIIAASANITGCKKVFEYSPYNSELAQGYNGITTQLNLDKIKASSKGESHHFKIALLADSHYYLEDLAAAISAINKRNDVAFTVLAGDMSDQGLEKEYMLLYDQLIKLNTPLFTVIGNHDYLSNAEIIYKKMFGEYNYSFTYGSYNFVFFDSNFWEKNGSPDFNWLDNQLSSLPAERSVIVSHIPPFGDQYDEKSTAAHRAVTSKYNVPLSMHGHIHSYSFGDPYNDGTKYLVAPSTDKRQLCIVSFEGENITVTKENF